MTDYISREAALELLKEIEYKESSLNVAGSMICAIRDIPAADVAPVKHGTWLPIVEANEDGSPYQAGVFCSECGHPDCVETNYCSYCGAIMDGGAKDELPITD